MLDTVYSEGHKLSEDLNSWQLAIPPNWLFYNPLLFVMADWVEIARHIVFLPSQTSMIGRYK